MDNRPMNTRQHLHRSVDHRIIFGVAGGLAEYFDVDPTLVRLGFVAVTFLSWGTGIIVYLLLATILPKDGTTTPPRETLRENIQEMGTEARHTVDRIAGMFRR